MSGEAIGYITLETLQGLGYPGNFSELRLRATRPPMTRSTSSPRLPRSKPA